MACPGRALTVAMVVVMAVALVRPGGSNTQKKRSGEASAKPLRDPCEARPRIAENLEICIHGTPQTGVSSGRNDYFSAVEISVGFWSSKAVVSCARDAHFGKNVKK